MSFSLKSFYQNVGQNWRGVCFLYLLLFLALCLILGMVRFHSTVSHFVVNEAPKIVNQIPRITISQGKVSTNVSEPKFIYNPRDGTILAVIDTTGRFTSLENTEVMLLLTKTKLIARTSVRKTQIMDLSEINDFLIDQNMIYNWLSIVKDWFAIMSYPFVVLASFLYWIVQILIYALIGILFSKMLHVSLGYQALIRLTTISIMPAILLNIAYDISLMICFLITMSFLFYAVKANSE